MFEASVQVCLSRQQHDVLEMRVIDVCVHSEESFEDDLDDVDKVLGEWDSQSTREDLLVVELVLHPGHQEVNVLARTHLQRRLHVVSVRPQVLVLRTCTHCRASLCRAELSQNTVEHIDFVIEFNGVDSKPFV